MLLNKQNTDLYKATHKFYFKFIKNNVWLHIKLKHNMCYNIMNLQKSDFLKHVQLFNLYPKIIMYIKNYLI